MMTQKHISVKSLGRVVGMMTTRAVNTLATVSLGTLLVMASHAQNLIVNGSFETPISDNNYGSNPATWFAGQTFGSWTVEFGSVDIKRGVIPAYEGVQCIDMNGSPGRGAIYQDFTVSSDGLYTLQFAMNGNYGYLPDSRQMRVQILQGTATIFSQDYTHTYDPSASSQPWAIYSANINLSSGSYRLRFESLEYRAGGDGTVAYGPALDDVRLELVPEPASMVALGMGLAGLLGLRRRRQH